MDRWGSSRIIKINLFMRILIRASPGQCGKEVFILNDSPIRRAGGGFTLIDSEKLPIPAKNLNGQIAIDASYLFFRFSVIFRRCYLF